MSKHKRNKNNKNDPDKLCKHKLLKAEVEKYKAIGVMDRSQNWLELFTPTVVSDLFTIMHSCSDNQLKASYIRQELSYYGFEEVGLGTNIYTMANPAYPGVVFKFALDDNGMADNFNDAILEQMVNEHLGKRRYTATVARHPSGIVSVQQRKVVISDQDRMDTYRASILKALKKLSEIFLIVDLSPTHYHLNYGIDRNGDWCFVDASDLYPLENIKKKVRCQKAVGYNEKKHEVVRCGGLLRYNADFSAIVCSRCGMEFLPLEIRPKDKEGKGKMVYSMTDGVHPEDREKWRQEELAAMRGESYTEPDDGDDEDEAPTPKRSRYPSKDHPVTVFVDPKRPPDDEPEEESSDDEDDEDGEVGGPTVGEPENARPQSFSEFLGKKPVPDDIGDEDDDEEEIAKSNGVRAVVDATDSDEDDPDDDSESYEDEDGQGDEVEDRLVYRVINEDPENDTDDPEILPGIHIEITGNFYKAYAKYGLPVFVTFDGGKTTMQVVNAELMKSILTPGVEDAKEEMDAIHGNG